MPVQTNVLAHIRPQTTGVVFLPTGMLGESIQTTGAEEPSFTYRVPSETAAMT